jgi:hypothetical protein
VSNTNIAQGRARALEAAARGDLGAAFEAIEEMLGYPRDDLATTDLVTVLETAERVLGDAFPEAAKALGALAAAPEDVDLLYGAGYALVEVELVTWATTLLERAHRIAPADERVLCELATALEMQTLHRRVVELLDRRHPALTDRFMPRYLLAFNAAMAGDLGPARAEAPWLDRHAGTEAERFMARRIAGIVARGAALTPAAGDVRAFTCVIAGGLVLALGEDRGRFAALDDRGVIRAATEAIGAALARLGRAPDRVLLLEDPPSRALGLAAATLLDLPAAPLDEGPGLVVTWDVGGLRPDDELALRTHRPGQVLWSHTLRFTRPHRVMPDLITGWARSTRTPWEKDEPPEAAAAAIAGAAASPASADLDALVALAEATRGLGEHAAGVWRDEGERPKAWPLGDG